MSSTNPAFLAGTPASCLPVRIISNAFRQTDEPRQPHGPAPRGQDTDLDLRQTEFGRAVIGDDTPVTRKGQFQSTTHAETLDRRCAGYAQIGDAGEGVVGRGR